LSFIVPAVVRRAAPVIVAKRFAMTPVVSRPVPLGVGRAGVKRSRLGFPSDKLGMPSGGRATPKSATRPLAKALSVSHDSSSVTRELEPVKCKSRPDSVKARKSRGKGGAKRRDFIPWCD